MTAISLQILKTCWVCIVVLASCQVAVAQIDESTAKQPPQSAPSEPAEGGTRDVPDKAAVPPEKSKEPADADGLPSLESELLEDLLGESKTQDAADAGPLENAVSNMRAVQERLAIGQANDETLQVQQQIIDDLSRLIALAEKQQNSPKSEGGKSPQSSDPQQKKEENQQQQSQQNPGQSQENDKAGESTDRQGKTTPTAAEAADRRLLVKDVWGHLPPSLREKLMNTYSENSLPKYAELIRRYYESLAETNRTRGQ